MSEESQEKLSDSQRKLEALKRSQLNFQAGSLNREIKENCSEGEKAVLAIVGREISQNGLSTKEACQMANITYEMFQHKYEENETFRKVIDFKRLEYKREILKTINNAVRQGDSKEAVRMLEKVFPEEYGNKGNTEDVNNNLLRQAIQFVRDNGDHDPLVKTGNQKVREGRSQEEKERDYEAELKELLV